jgi:hypothetical protein
MEITQQMKNIGKIKSKYMEQKKVVRIIFFTSLTIVSVILISAFTEYYFIPGLFDGIQKGKFVDKTLHPIFISFVSLLLATPPLYFVRTEAFLTWKKFTVISFPSLFIFIWHFSQTASNSSFVSDDIYIYILAPLFVIISYIIIGVKSWKLRGK